MQAPQIPKRKVAAAGGFTLLEVIIAVAILGISLISLLEAQQDALRATAYARDLTTAAFLAEDKLVDIEWQMRKDGWVESDVTFEGDFSEEGWPDMRYECLVDFMEMPEFTALLNAKSDADKADGDDDMVGGAADQAFGFLGIVWPQVKAGIESAIRKVQCTVRWKTGTIENEFDLATFWTNPEILSNSSDFFRNLSKSVREDQKNPGGMPGMPPGMPGMPGGPKR